MKKRIIPFIIAFIFSITAVNPVMKVYAVENEDNNMNIIVLFAEHDIDNDVKDIVTSSGGKIIKQIDELGGLEVECNPKLIPEIKSYKSVKSLSPERIIKIEKNGSIDLNDYYKLGNTDYYEDKGNSYYENKNNNYYADNGGSYYENNSSGYYVNNKENSDIDKEDEDLYEKYQWDIKRVTNNGESFSIESGNHDIVVGIVDSGVDTDHPDLKKNFLGGENFVPEDFQGDDTETGDSSDIEDRFGHGTGVAGQIAADGKIKGVAPGIGFKCYKVFNSEGQTNASICADAIIHAVDDGVNVINLSLSAYYLEGKCTWTDTDTGENYDLGDDMADYTLLKSAVEYALAHNVIVITAAGNEGFDCSDNKKLAETFNDLYSDQGFNYSGIIYEAPGSFNGVINVSATDKNDKISLYSNYGQDFIDITAPGGDKGKKFNINNMCITTSLDDGYIFDIGTSISAPKVSAAAALMLCQNKNLKPYEIEEKMYNNADILESNKYYGHGMLNVSKLLK